MVRLAKKRVRLAKREAFAPYAARITKITIFSTPRGLKIIGQPYKHDGVKSHQKNFGPLSKKIILGLQESSCKVSDQLDTRLIDKYYVLIVRWSNQLVVC